MTHRDTHPNPEGPRWVDQIPCKKCGVVWGRTKNQAMMHLKECPACRAEYKRQLLIRHNNGDPLLVRKCAKCGGSLRRNVKGELHSWCNLELKYDTKAEEVRERIEEWNNPTKEETWLRKGTAELSKVRKALRDASK